MSITGSMLAAAPSKEEALATMKKAAIFMVEHVSVRGGYIDYVRSLDPARTANK